MNTNPSVLLKVALASLLMLLAGCASYYQPRYSDSGVYYEERYPAQTRVYVDAGYVNPAYYPYWSMDYFYMSRYRAPYSVVHFRTTGFGYGHYGYYPGWYYGYRAPARFGMGFSYGSWYPWYGYGHYYHHYRPWYAHHHYHHHYHHYARPQAERRTAVRGAVQHDRSRSDYRRDEEPRGRRDPRPGSVGTPGSVGAVVGRSSDYRNELDRQQRQDVSRLNVARARVREGEERPSLAVRSVVESERNRTGVSQRGDLQRAIRGAESGPVSHGARRGPGAPGGPVSTRQGPASGVSAPSRTQPARPAEPARRGPLRSESPPAAPPPARTPQRSSPVRESVPQQQAPRQSSPPRTAPSRTDQGSRSRTGGERDSRRER